MRTYKRLMQLPDPYTGETWRGNWKYANCLPCDECGDIIEPGDYYYRVTIKSDFGFVPDEKYNLCVGCHCLEKEVAALESA